MTPAGIPSPMDFYSRLKWLDGRPLLATLDEYRRDLMQRALYTFRDDGTPLYNFVLSGRAKKNFKSADLALAAFYRLLVWPSPQGNDALLIANDEDQAADDLSLAKKLVAVNPVIARELETLQKEIRRRDGAGTMRILPGRDATGAHGKTALFIGFDEIHGYRNYDLFEALAPDPTRPDALVWATSYDSIWQAPGIPLVDFKAAGQRGDDPRMLFSWYSADFCTDPAFADLPPEERANPSMASWPEGAAYLAQQRRRLPSHKFRRLHLNLPGAPEGAFLDGSMVQSAIITGRRVLPRSPGLVYSAFVDMSGGSSDDACLAIAHQDHDMRVLDLLVSQDGGTPFDPRRAVAKFARHLQEYGLNKVYGDNYAGETFKKDFEAEGIKYIPAQRTKTELYEWLEPELNAGTAELLDLPKLQEQALSLVVRGARVDHPPGGHDDWINAAAGALAMTKRSEAGKARIGFCAGGDMSGPITWLDQEPRRTPITIKRYTEKEYLALKAEGKW